MDKKKLKILLIVLIILILCLNIGVYAAYVLSSTDVSYTKLDETPVSVKEALDELYTKAQVPTHKIGDEVSLISNPDEKFYVLEWDNNSDVVTLMAKYNLNNTDFTSQVDATYDNTKCAFSSTNYWSSEKSYPLNLNDYYGYSSTDALGRAKSYGRSIGAVSSRLLSFEEANALVVKASSNTKIATMLWGQDSTQGYLNYWLGSAYDAEVVWNVYGGFSAYNGSPFDYVYLFGVRPVITILKSKIS